MGKICKAMQNKIFSSNFDTLTGLIDLQKGDSKYSYLTKLFQHRMHSVKNVLTKDRRHDCT